MEKKIKELISKLDTSSDKSAQSTILKLEKIGRPAIDQLMLAAKNKSQHRVRKWSLQALGAIGEIEAAPLLLKALKDEIMTVKLHAIRGLVRMEYKPAAKKITPLLKDSSGGVRVNALQALLSIGVKPADSVIIDCLSDEQWYVRQLAARVCGHFRISKSIPVLKRIAKKETKKAVILEIKKTLKLLGQ